MRPHPQSQHIHDESGRIIHLGEVRRRRSGRRRQAPDQHYLAFFVLIAVCGWASWLTVVLTLRPARFLTYLAFFAPLFVALTATAAIVAYGIEWRLGRLPGLVDCVRRGTLVSALLVANLAFQGAHRWSLMIGAVSVAAATGLELLADRLPR